MEHESHLHKHRMAALPSGIAFGAAGALFSNIGISLTIFCLNLVYGLLLPRYYTSSTPSFWITDVIPLVLIVSVAILFIWVGVCVTAWIIKKRDVVSVAHKLPLYTVGFFFIPTLFWIIMRLLGDLTGGAGIQWLPLGYLFAQGLIFGGALYFFLERYRRKITHEESVLAPLIKPNHRAHCYVAGFFTFIFSIALLVKLHTLEVIFGGTGRPVLIIGGASPLSDMDVLGICAAAILISLGILLFLRKDRSPKAVMKALWSFTTLEYFFASVAVASGVLTAVGFAAQIDFIFTPYTILLSTTSILFGMILSAIRYAEGKRDTVFVITRTVAYIIGFFGQPTVLGAILAIIKQITG